MQYSQFNIIWMQESLVKVPQVVD